MAVVAPRAESVGKTAGAESQLRSRGALEPRVGQFRRRRSRECRHRRGGRPAVARCRLQRTTTGGGASRRSRSRVGQRRLLAPYLGQDHDPFAKAGFRGWTRWTSSGPLSRVLGLRPVGRAGGQGPVLRGAWTGGGGGGGGHPFLPGESRTSRSRLSSREASGRGPGCDPSSASRRGRRHPGSGDSRWRSM